LPIKPVPPEIAIFIIISSSLYIFLKSKNVP